MAAFHGGFFCFTATNTFRLHMSSVMCRAKFLAAMPATSIYDDRMQKSRRLLTNVEASLDRFRKGRRVPPECDPGQNRVAHHAGRTCLRRLYRDVNRFMHYELSMKTVDGE